MAIGCMSAEGMPSAAKAFMAEQQGKVKARQEEMKKIKKGIYQMKVMMESEEMETFKKECEKSDARTAGSQPEKETAGKETESMAKKGNKTDPQTEMEKMLSAGRMFSLNQLT